MEEFFSELGTAPGITLIILVVVIVISNIITWWKLYSKAGQAGWKSIVPVYKYIVMARIGKSPEKYGWFAGVLSALTSFNHPISVIFFFGYIWAYILLLRDFIKQYDAPLIFWLYAVALPIIAVFQVNDVQYTGQREHETTAPKT